MTRTIGSYFFWPKGRKAPAPSNNTPQSEDDNTRSRLRASVQAWPQASKPSSDEMKTNQALSNPVPSMWPQGLDEMQQCFWIEDNLKRASQQLCNCSDRLDVMRLSAMRIRHDLEVIQSNLKALNEKESRRRQRKAEQAIVKERLVVGPGEAVTFQTRPLGWEPAPLVLTLSTSVRNNPGETSWSGQDHAEISPASTVVVDDLVSADGAIRAKPGEDQSGGVQSTMLTEDPALLSPPTTPLISAVEAKIAAESTDQARIELGQTEKQDEQSVEVDCRKDEEPVAEPELGREPKLTQGQETVQRPMTPPATTRVDQTEAEPIQQPIAVPESTEVERSQSVEPKQEPTRQPMAISRPPSPPASSIGDEPPRTPSTPSSIRAMPGKLDRARTAELFDQAAKMAAVTPPETPSVKVFPGRKGDAPVLKRLKSSGALAAAAAAATAGTVSRTTVAMPSTQAKLSSFPPTTKSNKVQERIQFFSKMQKT